MCCSINLCGRSRQLTTIVEIARKNSVELAIAFNIDESMKRLRWPDDPDEGIWRETFGYMFV
jgi:hypothetical protein